MNPQKNQSPVKERILNRQTSDHLCAVMLSLGYSSTYIQKETGLSPGAISYRVKLTNLRRRDYRNGNSQIAAVILKTAVTSPAIDKNLEKDIIKGLAQMERERHAKKAQVT